MKYQPFGRRLGRRDYVSDESMGERDDGLVTHFATGRSRTRSPLCTMHHYSIGRKSGFIIAS